jgi:Repeat of unknown function (DUF5907)
MRNALKRLAVVLGLACAAGPAFAQSTINTSVPPATGPLLSLPIRNNFLAAASDINGILGMHPAASLAGCPSTTLTGTDCLVTGSSPAVWYKSYPGGYGEIGTFNTSTGAFSVALSSGSILGTLPIAVTITSGAATVALNFNSSLVLDGGNNLGINLSHANAWTVAQTMPGVSAPASTNLALNAPTGNDLQFQINGAAITVQQAAAFLPTSDNAVALGGASNRWSNIYGVAATIGTLTLTNPLTPANGGTGLATLTAHAVLLGEGTSNVAFATIGTAGRMLLDQGGGADPLFAAMSGDATITNAGLLTVGANAITYAKFQQVAATSLVGNPTGSLANMGGITLGSTLNFSGTTLNATTATSSQLGAVKFDNSTITLNGSGQIQAIGAAATSISAGSGGTTILGTCTASGLLYNNSSVVYCETIATALGTRTTNPTSQTFTSGSGTYTTPANVLWIEVWLRGGGGGGGGSAATANTPTSGGAGGNTTFGTSLYSAVGGGGGTFGNSSANGAGGAGGSGGIGTAIDRTSGTQGEYAYASSPGGLGGNSCVSGGGYVTAGSTAGAVGVAGVTNSGGGGSGGILSGGTAGGGGGGGGGECAHFIINGPSATYSYSVGAAGSAGTAPSGNAGGAGGSGQVYVVEHYGS